MRRVEGVIAEHIERFLRHVVLHHLVNVAVVPKRKVHTAKSAVRLIDTVLRLEEWILHIWIRSEVFREHYIFRIGAPHREGITNNSPLRFTHRHKTLPRSWRNPVNTNHRGCPSLRIASEV